jgi:transposase InsO family protein
MDPARVQGLKYWRWKSRRRGGRPRINRDIRDLIRQMNRENPLWGAPRIHGELQMLGIEIAESTVSRYMCRRRQPPSQGWKTFLRNHAAGIASVDLFVVRTISFKLLYGLVILRHARRRLVSISVTNNPTAEWIAGQVTDAFPWDEAPRHLIRDRDGAFGPAYTRRIRAMGIRDHPTAPRSPWQNGHVERLIGSIRRESIDQLHCVRRSAFAPYPQDYASYTTRSGLIFHWTRMRRTSAVLCRSAPSRQFRSLAGCIINTRPGLGFP